MLPDGDRTPPDFMLPLPSLGERLKRPFRRVLYPFYTKAVDAWIRHRGYSKLGLEVDFWLWGQRGNDYEALRRRVNRIIGIRGKQILIAGCGTGRDILSWLSYEPRLLTGVDYFDYARAWKAVRDFAHKRYPRTTLTFRQADLAYMDTMPGESVDVVGSDAVFEHLRNLPAVLREFHRILRPGGVLYATFGPLWYCWGGDHFSGHDGILAGYNHLLLAPETYEAYLCEAGPHRHSEHDGRTWIKNDLFSRLRPIEYLAALETAGFRRLEVGAIIEPRAVQCIQQSAAIRDKLLANQSLLDSVVTGMTIIYRK
ncbi:MAG: class I SAM-dependent methyltransferase [Rhodocyclaceae bacterium]|nr:class I SAM-dependent methyltransferase [Rhodocyclaceae bacterium]